MNFFRKGSKKSLVKTVHIVCEQNTAVACENIEDSSNNLHQPDMSQAVTRQMLQEKNKTLLEAKCVAEDKTNYFEKVLKDKESEILTMSNEMETLLVKLSELETLNKKNEAKLKQLSNLEELEKLKGESTKRFEHMQRKVKRLKEVNAKSKQEYALELFLLKDEKKNLLERNESLQGHLHQIESTSCSNCLENRRDPSFSVQKEEHQLNRDSDSQNRLVVQLSQQVSSLDNKNQELKKELNKAHALLNSLSCKTLNTNSIYEHQELCVNMASFDLLRKTSSEQLG